MYVQKRADDVVLSVIDEHDEDGSASEEEGMA